jgi:hypothetical protein
MQYRNGTKACVGDIVNHHGDTCRVEEVVPLQDATNLGYDMVEQDSILVEQLSTGELLLLPVDDEDLSFVRHSPTG